MRSNAHRLALAARDQITAVDASCSIVTNVTTIGEYLKTKKIMYSNMLRTNFDNLGLLVGLGLWSVGSILSRDHTAIRTSGYSKNT